MVTSHLFRCYYHKTKFTGLGHWSEQPFEAMHKDMKVSINFIYNIVIIITLMFATEELGDCVYEGHYQGGLPWQAPQLHLFI